MKHDGTAKHGLPCHVVAITGRSGSGKSTVSTYYTQLGYPVLDGDAVAREITEIGQPCLAQLAQAFGADILDETGALLRRELAARAFATEDSARLLTRITHPAITAHLLHSIAGAAERGAALVFVDGAVIVGADFEPYCDAIVVVDAPEREAILRIMLRDGISKQAVRNRLAAQLSRQQLLDAADEVIHNEGSKQALLSQADVVLQHLCEAYGLPVPNAVPPTHTL